MQIGQAPVQTGPEAGQNFPSSWSEFPSMSTVGFFLSFLLQSLFFLLCVPPLSAFPCILLFLGQPCLTQKSLLLHAGRLPPFLWRVLSKVTVLSLALAPFLLEIHSLTLVDAHQ